jgi:hypothetical protein
MVPWKPPQGPRRDFTRNVEEEDIRRIVELSAAEWEPYEIAQDIGTSVVVVTQILKKYARLIPEHTHQKITPAQFDLVQAGRAAGKTSIEVMRTYGLDLREVNAAWCALDYIWYESHRNKKTIYIIS